MKLHIEKHPFKDLFRISTTGFGSFSDWQIASVLGKTCIDYQRCLQDLGASPEIDIVPRNQWSRYQLWFRSKEETQNALDWFEADHLMNTISKKSPMGEVEDDY